MLKLFLQDKLIEAGCDEAGRGCLAGPVFAAAVILPKDFSNDELNDSKQLNEEQRNRLRPVIEASAVAWAVGVVNHEEIDRINILKASILAMHRAIAKLSLKPGLLLIDGNRFHRYAGILHTCIVQGDGIYASIAAASVLAKTYRDDFMQDLHKQYPGYGWDQNKGYATARHRSAIRELGLSPLHRKSFRLAQEEPELPF